jgi:hypothetical protein
MKLINLFLVKKAYNVKRQDFSNFFFTAFYWSGTGTITCQKSEPEP